MQTELTETNTPRRRARFHFPEKPLLRLYSDSVRNNSEQTDGCRQKDAGLGDGREDRWEQLDVSKTVATVGVEHGRI